MIDTSLLKMNTLTQIDWDLIQIKKKCDLHPCNIFQFKNKNILCGIDDQMQPAIEIGHTRYHTMCSLLKDYPEISERVNLNLYINLANFLFNSSQFEPITDIESYKREFSELLACINNSYELCYRPRTCFKTKLVDLDSLHPPKLKNNQVIFYAKEKYSHTPYKVTCPHPINTDKPTVSYEVLQQKTIE